MPVKVKNEAIEKGRYTTAVTNIPLNKPSQKEKREAYKTLLHPSAFEPKSDKPYVLSPKSFYNARPLRYEETIALDKSLGPQVSYQKPKLIFPGMREVAAESLDK